MMAATRVRQKFAKIYRIREGIWIFDSGLLYSWMSVMEVRELVATTSRGFICGKCIYIYIFLMREARNTRIEKWALLSSWKISRRRRSF